MIRIDAVWLATAPLDMRAGTDSALARVVAVFGAAQPHHAYLGPNVCFCLFYPVGQRVHRIVTDYLFDWSASQGRDSCLCSWWSLALQ